MNTEQPNQTLPQFQQKSPLFYVITFFGLGFIVGFGIALFFPLLGPAEVEETVYPDHDPVNRVEEVVTSTEDVVEVEKEVVVAEEGMFTLDGREYPILRVIGFEDGGDASLVHLCDYESNLTKGLFWNKRTYCFGENLLVYTSANKTWVVDRREVVETSDALLLLSAAERMQTKGDVTGPKLVVVYEPTDCDFSQSHICMELPNTARIYDIASEKPEREFTPSVFFSSQYAKFSPNMEKYVMPTFCMEGCPNYAADAQNVVTGGKIKILEDIDLTFDQDKFLAEESYWGGNDLFVAVVQTEDGKLIERDIEL